MMSAFKLNLNIFLNGSKYVGIYAFSHLHLLCIGRKIVFSIEVIAIVLNIMKTFNTGFNWVKKIQNINA